MNINDVYGGDFLKAAQLKAGRQYQLYIKGWELSEFHQDRDDQNKTQKQIVLSFHRTDKRLGLNRTNADAIAAWYGPDTRMWIDQKIVIQLENVRAFGEIKPAIRVVLPQPGQGYLAQQQAGMPPAPPHQAPQSAPQAPAQSQPQYVDPPAGYDNAPPQQAPGPGDSDPFSETRRPPPDMSNGQGSAPAAPQSGAGPTIPDDDDFDDDIPF